MATGAYNSPGDVFQAPGAPYVSPGEMPPPGGRQPYPPYGPPPVNPYGRAGAGERESRKTTIMILIVVVAAILVIGTGAGLYYGVFGKTKPTGPQLGVVEYFDALSSGNAEAVKSACAPDGQPGDDELAALQSIRAVGGSVAYKDIQMVTLTETPSEATVQVNDATISFSIGGQSFNVKLSSYGNTSKLVLTLKNVNGKWLVVAPKQGNLYNPTGGTGTITVPRQGSS